MYNRYIPNGTAYSRIPQEDAPPFQPPGPRQPPRQEKHRQEEGHHRKAQGQEHRENHRTPPPRKDAAGVLEGAVSRLGGVLKSLHLDDIDSGDILLVLILLFLFLESDDNLELVITLGLLLLFGLFGKDGDEQEGAADGRDGHTPH